MQYGLGLYTGQVPPGEDITFRDEYARIIEQAKLAEAVGLDSIWLSEHHGAADGYLPSVLPLASAILACTTRLVVGTAVLLAPFHDPLRLAEDVAVLDQMSGGRFILGMGTGWRRSEFRAFGANPATRGRALEETVEVLRRAWQGERFTFDGRVHQIGSAIVRPQPFTPGGPPIWLGGTGPRALARAGRLGDGYFGVCAPFDAIMSTYSRVLESAPDERRNSFSFGQLRSGFIADDPELGWKIAGKGMTYTQDVHARWAAEEAGDPVAPDANLTPEGAVRQYNLIGTVDEVTDALRPYEQRFAGRTDSHLCFRLYHPYMPHDAVLDAIQTFGRLTVPGLRATAEGQPPPR
ncbi:LLM class flavin-dependent oxidoreductase [Rhodococcus sp. MSC1_016]|jgi:probable F420-dependent oxidoreductase|uniref:LLM class flavin-dependent oxidoreductase n=1 Tax=Rhodococcus sp. MSC1_016 TaxID=2909266 RepID=UPI00202F6264|nr:LLM class flavin-dependent oxidoreductase [Rhodococcus sp. MSC1_016]